MIPELTEEGVLPPGIHEASWDELEATYGYSLHRRRLLQGLRRAAKSLAQAGCRTLYIDGSFTTSKQVPGDFDACWDAGGVDPNLVDPVLLDFTNLRAAQKAKFGGELFVAQHPAVSPPRFSIFLDFFQQTKDGVPKGIIAIDLQRWKP